MKKLALSVIVLAGLALLASCKKDNDSINGTFKASIEQQNQNGKTAIDTTNGHITWNAGDEILISNGSDSETFTLQTGEGTTNGTFSTAGALAMTGNYTAAYPATASIDGTTVTFSLPATQTMANGESGTFANGANPMVAVANGTTNLAFKNPCGGLGIRLKGATEGITVTNIRIIGGSDDILWGNLTVTMDGGDVATTSIANTATGKNIIDLTCNVTLSTTEAKRFFIVLPEGALQHGFTLEVSYGAAEPYSKSTGDTDIAQVQRNTMKSLNAITIGTVAPVVTLPAVTTTDVTSITTNSAVSGGENIDGGGGTISEYGICWSETANPTIENDTLHHLGEPLMTDYSFTMTGLDENTTYHVRAYVTNEAGTAYGEDKEFSTAAYVAPTVTTGTADATSATAATGHVTLTNAGNIGDVTEIGLCWGTSDNPTVSNNHAVAEGQVVGTEYAINITGLTAGAQYYVRGYAKVGDEYYYAANSATFSTVWNGNLGMLSNSDPVGFATATDGMTIYGTLNANVKISIVDDGATVTLNNATITGTNSDSYLWAGINCENNATIILEGTNNVTSFWEDYPGIYIAPDKTLIIQGSGTLNASSNGGANGWGAGIGGSDLVDCGNIVINSGTINATGGIWMAGIGGGFGKNCGSITINGGNVTATGGRGAAGIGTGVSQVSITCGDISITGGVVNATGGRGAAGIGSGFVTYNGILNTCGNISITGGQVTATGGDGGDHVYPDILTHTSWANYTYYGGAGIGTGSTSNEGSSSCGTITIGSGVTSVTATKGGGTRPATNSIGKNHSSNPGTCGTITIGGTEYPSGATPNQADGLTFVYPYAAPAIPAGAINGLFSVSSTKQVYFSKGSLQYIGSASTPYWKFADNQWDLLSITNQNTNNTNVDRDIFSWGTSGYAHGASIYQPWGHGTNNNQFYAYGDQANYLSASTGTADWGYNAISNGGNQEHLWYTLNKDEWTYLFSSDRPGSTVNGTDKAHFARATVEGINGVILFPDIYTHPTDVNQPNYINSNSGGWANTYTAADFMKMEAHGAVFLPAGGGYVGGNIVNRNGAAFYWSSQPDNNGNALGLYLNNNSINCANSMYRHLGIGVRLVRNAE